MATRQVWARWAVALAAAALLAAPGCSSKPEPAKDLTLDLGGGVTMKMVRIGPGKFIMDQDNDHKVTITKPFYMGITEVTQAQYEAVMGENPNSVKGPTNPVDRITWDEAVEFCRRLSKKTGRAVRLPTEAEWEYACRAGTQTEFSFGDDPSALGDYAWWAGNSAKTTHPVGQKKPNAWGLYDMHGNVCEWCADWYGEYPKGPATDPSGPATGHLRVVRGGSCSDDIRECQKCNTRGCLIAPPGSRGDFYGFRVAVSVSAPGL